MKIRIQYAKYGRMAYLGHLDVMRFFQKALRRAEVDLAFTQGFSPHPILSFAAPLGLGIESFGEYADLSVHSTDSSEDMLRRLKAVMVPGMEVRDWRLLPERAENAMASVAAADYCLVFREGKVPADIENYFARLEAFLKEESIVTTITGKNGSREVDIRPWIYDHCFRIEDGEPALYFQTSTGSRGNLKPEYILSAFAQREGLVFDAHDVKITRLETYTRQDEELIPMIEVGSIITGPMKDEPAEG